MPRLASCLFFASQLCCEKAKWCWGQHNHLLKQEVQTLCFPSSQHTSKDHPVLTILIKDLMRSLLHSQMPWCLMWRQEKIGNKEEIYGVVSNPKNNRTVSLFPFPLFSVHCFLYKVHGMILGRSQATERCRIFLLKSLLLVPEVQKLPGMSHV